MYKVVDFKTREPLTPKNLVFTGKDGPWEIIIDLEQTKGAMNEDYFRASPPLVSKYLPFMPIKNHSTFVSLKEGGTPLIRAKHLGAKLGIDLWFKLEMQNPTGSFKDRGSAVDLTVARELGAKAIVLASTGNMAASCACYAAAAGIPCFVFVPEDTPQTKLAQVISYGGHVVQVKGRYNDAARVSEEVAEACGFYLAGDYAFRVEGQKTAAFEICDQLFFQVPDVLIVPVGCGTNIAAYAKGFSEYHKLGLIDRVPQLVGVQASGAAAVVNAFRKGAPDCESLKSIDTIASAIAVSKPLDGAKALKAIYNTHGSAVAVTDSEMLRAQYELSTLEGLFVECSCASALAAALKLNSDGSLQGKRVVLVMTGSGLKDPAPLLRVALRPPTIYPEAESFLSLYRNNFFHGRSVSFFNAGEVIFDKEPTSAEIKERVSAFFAADYPDSYIEQILTSVQKFLKKGKSVKFTDFQDIVEESLRTLQSRREEVLLVEDFEVTTGKDRQPRASVVVQAHGQRREGQGTGVGPVDAIISALTHASVGLTPFQLLGYKVDIRGEGPDAVVNVELKLKVGDALSVGLGISPDIIQASIEAFVEAYNNVYTNGSDNKVNGKK